MFSETGRPMRGAKLERLKAFLQSCELDYDPNIDFTVVFEDEDGIAATGSLDGATIKCIAVSPDHRGEDLSARLMTALMTEAFDRGARQLMLFTKPVNAAMFAPFGFTTVVRTPGCLLMENARDGVGDFLRGLDLPEGADGDVGCIVANCNPITNGHRYLIERAAGMCDHLYVFVLSEEKSLIPAKDRLRLVREVCAPLKNVRVFPGGRYMISSATFPSYFIRDKARVETVYCETDVALFGARIAPALGINKRFVGTEPFDPVTRFYNGELKRLLPGYGIELIEIERLISQGEPVSASRARALYEAGELDALRALLPGPSLRYLTTLSKGE